MINNEMKIFDNVEFGQVRTIMVDDIPWFVGKDVATALGYSETNVMTRRLDSEDFISTKLSGMNMKSTLINESGLYAAILGSKLPTAKKFKHWVTSEVLPSIRKYGLYARDELLNDPDLFISALQDFKAAREKAKLLELENAKNKQLIAEMKPKVSYYDLILQNNSLMPISKIAKDYGMSGRALNKLLHELGVQYNMSGTWLLYQDYANKGYTQSKTHKITDDKSKMHTYWTQAGRLFLYDLLKNKRSIYPVIECESA